ncbi:MAG: pyrroline-5-carboxylate reductase [Acidimicrobiales bacterium]
MAQLQIIGGGKMGEALLGGLLARGWATPAELTVVEKLSDRRDLLAAALPGVDVRDRPTDGVDAIVAVKPDAVDSVCRELARHNVARVLSIAAGIRIERLEASLDDRAAVVRAMPNTPALVGLGAAAIARGTHATDADIRWAESILSSVGEVLEVDESLLDAVTGLSGSGPAYVFLLAEAMIDAGVAVGLPRDVSVALTEQTLLGAATLLRQSGDGPAVLRQNVTSPGGTTAAGLAVFENARFRQIVVDVVTAATARSVELSTT